MLLVRYVVTAEVEPAACQPSFDAVLDQLANGGAPVPADALQAALARVLADMGVRDPRVIAREDV